MVNAHLLKYLKGGFLEVSCEADDEIARASYHLWLFSVNVMHPDALSKYYRSE